MSKSKIKQLKKETPTPKEILNDDAAKQAEVEAAKKLIEENRLKRAQKWALKLEQLQNEMNADNCEFVIHGSFSGNNIKSSIGVIAK
jgi:predicted outer membrane protein